MKNNLQIEALKKEVDLLQKLHGNPQISAIYGAGQVNNPNILFLFMNPTAKNIAANTSWKGLKAPWLGTKNIWKLFNQIGILADNFYLDIANNSPDWWTEEFSFDLYRHLFDQSVYVTNLAKCTQDDARPLKDKVFRDYLKNTLSEIATINPKKIISFGNQVSTILLNKSVKVSAYKNDEFESLDIDGKKFKVYPTYYPVGQGMRNITKAIERLSKIVK